MKTTYKWLQDFVDIRLEPQELAHRLTMVGLEVTSLEAAQGDFVFEIEVTPNRPDCLSVIGIACEVAAITGAKFKIENFPAKTGSRKMREKFKISRTQEPASLKIHIEDKNDCPLYTAKIIRDVKVGPSPDWLKKRLELIGCRSINNIVDITNYVLFTYGEPLHAFDLDKLKGDTIFIRRAKHHEKITAINGVEYKLTREVLIIADSSGPVAIAGVMGGEDTEVTESTSNILLEAAIFHPVVIRRGRQQLGLQSDSSYRFERGIDANIVEPSAWQVVRLVEEGGGRCVGFKSSPRPCSQERGSPVPKARTLDIMLDAAKVCRILGIDMEPLRIKSILSSLDFSVKSRAKGRLYVRVPSHRLDVNAEIDLIEEVARLYGYERMPVSLPKVLPRIEPFNERDIIVLIKNVLVGLGLCEVITNSLMDSDFLKGLALQVHGESIRILNPLSKEQEILRPTLIPSILRCVGYNLNQKQEYINIFEVAKAFTRTDNHYLEEPVLTMALCGMKSLLLEQGLIKERMSLLHLKGIIETLFERLGIKEYAFTAASNSEEIAIMIKQEKAGIISGVSQEALQAADIKNKDVFVAEVILEKVFPAVNLQKRFVVPPVYPAISRDISFILKEDVNIDQVLGALKEQGKPLLKEVRLVDYYKGKQIPAGFRGFTISCIYRLDERTLTEDEVNPVHVSLSAVLTDKFNAKIR